MVFNLNKRNGIAFNLWEATKQHPFEVYEPGYHHVAFIAIPGSKVDEAAALVQKLGGEIWDGPGEFPFAHGGYYAVYFPGLDRPKFEIVHMPIMERDRSPKSQSPISPGETPK